MIKAKNAGDLKVSIKESEDDPLAGLVAVTEALGGYFGAKSVVLSPLEQAALWSVLERETTSRPVHDGLRGLLSLSHDHADALLALLRRLF
jgi:hypothetical protein